MNVYFSLDAVVSGQKFPGCLSLVQQKQTVRSKKQRAKNVFIILPATAVGVYNFIKLRKVDYCKEIKEKKPESHPTREGKRLGFYKLIPVNM